MRTILLSAAFILTLGLFACAEKEAETADQSRPATESTDAGSPRTAHAPADVVPGSYEDWCDEHQVAETMCTRCNPALVAAFKATGDWCAEHGLPESQCLACNPDLKIVRPEKPSAEPKTEG